MTEAGVRAARERAQEALGGADGIHVPGGGLRTIDVEGSCQLRNVDAELLALCAPGSLRRLRLEGTSAPAGAAALAALLQPFACSLVHLDVGGRPSTPSAASATGRALAWFIAQPGSRLRFLNISSGIFWGGRSGRPLEVVVAADNGDDDDVNDAAEAAPNHAAAADPQQLCPFGDFCDALAGNSSLSYLWVCGMGSECAVVLADALARRKRHRYGSLVSSAATRASQARNTPRQAVNPWRNFFIFVKPQAARRRPSPEQPTWVVARINACAADAPVVLKDRCWLLRCLASLYIPAQASLPSLPTEERAPRLLCAFRASKPTNTPTRWQTASEAGSRPSARSR